MRKASVTVAACATLLWAGTALCVAPASALTRCTATIRLTDGTILVGAKGVSAPLLWGNNAGTETNAFNNAATCVTGSVAKNCQLGATASPLAITPPPLCRVYLKDGVGTCSARITKCTPGTRPLVELPSRFVDHGDGTVTDTRTGLMWEKKTDDSTIHDKDDTYTWSTGSPYNPDGTAFFTFLAALNGPRPFAGYGDWRLPTITELQTIVDCSSGSPCIDQSVFGPTQSNAYWSPITSAGYPDHALFVSFDGGGVNSRSKANDYYVRAVRSGL